MALLECPERRIHLSWCRYQGCSHLWRGFHIIYSQIAKNCHTGTYNQGNNAYWTLEAMQDIRPGNLPCGNRHENRRRQQNNPPGNALVTQYIYNLIQPQHLQQDNCSSRIGHRHIMSHYAANQNCQHNYIFLSHLYTAPHFFTIQKLLCLHTKNAIMKTRGAPIDGCPKEQKNEIVRTPPLLVQSQGGFLMP